MMCLGPGHIPEGVIACTPRCEVEIIHPTTPTQHRLRCLLLRVKAPLAILLLGLVLVWTRYWLFGQSDIFFSSRSVGSDAAQTDMAEG